MNYGWNFYQGNREVERGVVTIYEYERGLLYRNGAFLRVLEAGRYRLWSWNRSLIRVVDVRRQSVQPTSQKLLTSDQVTVGLNLVADYEIADVVLATHSVVNAQTQLYEDVQLATRNVVGATDVNVCWRTAQPSTPRFRNWSCLSPLPMDCECSTSPSKMSCWRQKSAICY